MTNNESIAPQIPIEEDSDKHPDMKLPPVDSSLFSKCPYELLFDDEVSRPHGVDEILIPEEREETLETLREKDFLHEASETYLQKIFDLTRSGISFEGNDDRGLRGMLETLTESEGIEVVSGIQAELELTKKGRRNYFAFEYPEYGKAYYLLIRQASVIKENLHKKVSDSFSGVTLDEEVLIAIESLFDKKIADVFSAAKHEITEIDEQIEQLWFEHGNYEDGLLSDLMRKDYYEEAGLPIPKELKTKEEILSRVDDKKTEYLSFHLQEKHKALQERLLSQVKDLGTKLFDIDAEVYVFIGAFKILAERGVTVPFEEIKGVSVENLSAPDLSDSDRTSMESIYRTNYAQNPEFQKALMEKWSTVSNDPNNEFTVLRHEGNIAGFFRMENTAPSKKYFGAFNLDKTYRGGALGEALLTESVGEVAKENIIEADCDMREPITSKYIESGFIGVDNYDVKGNPSFHIVRNDRLHSELFTKSAQLTEEEIMSKARIGEQVVDGDLVVAAVLVKEIAHLPFSLITHTQGDKRVVLTRYIREKDERGEMIACAVFEKVSAEKLDEFMNGKKNITPPQIEKVSLPLSRE